MERSTRNVAAAILAGAALTLSACGGQEEDLVGDDSELAADEAKADSAAKVQVSTDKSKYGLTDLIKFTVENSYKVTSIYLPGCDAATLQKQTGSAWQDLGPEKACIWEGFAQKVAAGSTFQDSFGPKPAGTYRVKAAYKTGCGGKTFSQCTGKLRKAYSASFKVGQASNTCWSDTNCGANEYCHFADGDCTKLTLNLLTGTCKVKPQACIELYAPVCGCDGKTYGNSCFAAAAGVSVAAQGECASKEGEPCGDDVAIQKKCAAGLVCVFPEDGPISEHTPGVCMKPLQKGDVCGAGFSGSNGTLYAPCATGLKCCYPCGIPGCKNVCMLPCTGGPGTACAGGCPMFP